MKIKIKKERIFVGLSLLRIVLAFVIGLLIVNGKRDIAVIVFIAGALITFFESLAAQKLIKGLLLESALGFFADRIMINASVIALAFAHLIPFWVMIVFLAKDAVTFGIALTLYYRDYRREFKPTALGKITLFFQVIALIPPMMEGTDWVLMWIAIVITMAAGTESLFKSEFRLVRKKREMDDFRITRLVKFADVFTLTNVVFGIISILFAVKGWYNTASLMLILAVVSDYFDGKLAKATGQQNEFGKQLDSLADTVSFGVAPAIFGFTLIQTPLALMSFTIFLFCGILRLARYNIMNVKGAFRGMPITWNGLIIPLLYFSRNAIGLEIRHFPYIYLLLGILMVSSIKIKRMF